MNINLNIPVRLLIRFLRALEGIRDAYETVHALELRAARTKPDDAPIKFFYQSDQQLYEDELKEEARRQAAGM